MASVEAELLAYLLLGHVATLIIELWVAAAKKIVKHHIFKAEFPNLIIRLHDQSGRRGPAHNEAKEDKHEQQRGKLNRTKQQTSKDQT